MGNSKETELFDEATLNELGLLEPAMDKLLAKTEERAVYTAERLFLKKREIYNAIVQMLGIGVAMREIARACKVHFNTVAAVRSREPSLIAKIKETYIAKSSTNALVAQELMSEMMLNLNTTDKINAGSIYQMAQASGSLIDRANLLAGGVTERVEVVGDDFFDGGIDEYEKANFKEETK